MDLLNLTPESRYTIKVKTTPKVSTEASLVEDIFKTPNNPNSFKYDSDSDLSQLSHTSFSRFPLRLNRSNSNLPVLLNNIQATRCIAETYRKNQDILKDLSKYMSRNQSRYMPYVCIKLILLTALMELTTIVCHNNHKNIKAFLSNFFNCLDFCSILL